MNLIDIKKLPRKWFNPSEEKNFPGVTCPYVDGHTYPVLKSKYIERYHLSHTPIGHSDFEREGYKRV